MVGLSSGVFHISLLTPRGKLLACRAAHLVLPGHDGQTGILRNHAPMMCKLGNGLLRVEGIMGRKDAYFIVDGGFVRISENNVTVLAFDVTTFEGLAPDDAQKMLARASSVVYGGGYIGQMDRMNHDRAAMIVKMGKLARIEESE